MRKSIVFLFTLVLLLSVFPFSSQASANYVSVTKTVSPTSITIEEEALVTLNITGTPPVNVIRPNDVILIIDRSGSMSSENKMNAAIESAKGFIDLMDLTTHRVGVVDYSSDNNIGSFPLTTDKTAAKNYINNLRASGGTATGDAIRVARGLLADHRPDAQPVIVLMTDGDATEPTGRAYEYALENAVQAKEEGIVFYTIALLLARDNPTTSGPNLLLKEMATTSHHHHFVLGSVGLADIYAAIVKEIGLASAYDVVVKDTVSPEFEIVPGSYDDNIPRPVVEGNTLSWNFLELKTDVLSFTYKIRPKEGQARGVFPTSTSDSSIVYKDYSGAQRKLLLPITNLTVNYLKPTIEKVELDNGPVQGGETVVITGTNFRPNPTVRFGAVTASNVQYVSSTEIRVQAPAGDQGVVDLIVINDDRQQAKAKYTYYADPIINLIIPSSGPMAGGGDVTISGKYFLEGIKVKFGDQYSPKVIYKNNTVLTVTVPKSLQAGPVDVTLENIDQRSATLADGYTYIAPAKPTITSLTPNEGQLQGSELVVLKGSNIEAGARLYFNTKEVALTVVSDTEARFRAPSWSAPEQVDVKLVNPSLEEFVLEKGYTYLAPPKAPEPIISGLTPNSGQLKGNELVTLTGENLQLGVKLYFDNVEIPVTFVNDKQLRFRTPAWSIAEYVDVKVENPDLQGALLSDAYQYLAPPAPALNSITPNEGLISGGLSVSIKGNNFVVGAKVFFDTREINATYLSENELIIKTPAWNTAEAVDVKVVNPDLQEVVVADGFTYNEPPKAPEPTITEISPNNGLISGGDLVAITGTNFAPGVKVYFDSTLISATFVSDTTLRLRTPVWSSAKSVDVKVVNPDSQEVVLAKGFTYNELPKAPEPTITGISPNKGLTNGGDLVAITGTNFVPGAKVYFNSTLISASFLSDTSLRFRTPVWPTSESVDVKVVNPDGGEASLAGGYTYEKPVVKPPTISDISPNSSLMTGGALVYINGSDYQVGVKLYLNSTEVPVSILADNMLRFRVPVWSTAETVDVKVVNPDLQEAIALQAFTFTEPPKPKAPTITSVTPSSGPISGNNYVYIKGENYQAGAKVLFGATEGKSATLLDATQIRVMAPSASVLGTVDITVINPDTQSATLAGAYTYEEPPITITSISPAKGPIAGGQLVYVYGTNFRAGLSLQFNGQSLNYELLDAGTIRFRTPVATVPGNVSVVLTSAGGSVASTSYTYEAPPALPAPVINSLSPNHGPLAGGALVYVYGGNFRDGITATWGGAPLAITYLDSGTIRFRVPAGTTDGLIELKLTNTDNQSVTANYSYDAPPVIIPTITSLSTTSGPVAGNNLLYVYGTNFQVGAKVTIGSTTLDASVLDPATIRFRVPAVPDATTVTITVTNPDGKVSNSLSYQYQ